MLDKATDIEHWSRIAAEWTAWARVPIHDGFWAYRNWLLTFIGQGPATQPSCGRWLESRTAEGYRRSLQA